MNVMFLFNLLLSYWSFAVVALFSIVSAISQTPQYYGVVLDAGSTSTKLRIYSWNEAAIHTTPKQLVEYFTKKFKPGISGFVSDLSGLNDYLRPIVNVASDHIPGERHSETQIYLMATAGLRFLSSSNALALMNTVRDILSNISVCPFLFSRNNARILSGEEEGAFAWIAVNYLRGFFSGNTNSPVGVLEIGGGSAQITFLPDGPLYANKFPVRVAGRQYGIYTHSYLYYGLTYIGIRIKTHLMSLKPGLIRIDNPCMLRGDRLNFTYLSRSVTFVGIGDPLLCSSYIRYFLPKANSSWCYPKPCALGGVYQPPLHNRKYYAISVFAAVAAGLDALDENGRLLPSRIDSQARAHCSKTISEVAISGRSKPEFASADCLDGLYISMLLTRAFGFSTNAENIYVANKVNNKATSWSLGAILYENDQPVQRSGLSYECLSLATGSYKNKHLLQTILPISLISMTNYFYTFNY